MRKRIILSLISIFAFVFFSCSGLLSDVDENSSSNKAYVQIGDTSSRTVLPKLTTDDMTNIKLIGVKDGVRSELLSANTYSELSGKTKEIDAGTWSFELQATINGNTFTDSTSYKNNIEVNAGETVSLTFSAMETSATTGNFSVTVNYVGTADEVYVTLDNMPLSSPDCTVDVENNVVTVSKSNVEAGDYFLFIQFSSNDVVLNTFDEIVSVEGGCTSEATYTINLNKPTYSISFDTIVGGTVEASSTSATAGTEITLTATAKPGYYDFFVWNVTDASGNAVDVTDNKFTMPSSNVTVSATFTAIPYTVTIASTIANGTVTANAASAPVGTEITLTPAANPNYVFSAWNVTDASGKAVTVRNNKFSMPASNVTVSATFKVIPPITDALEDGAVLKITFTDDTTSRTGRPSTVTFTRKSDGTYSETHTGFYPEAARASAANGIITIDVTSDTNRSYDNGYFVYTLVIYTNDKKYTETIGGYNSIGLQKIEVNGTDVFTTLTKK